MLSVIAENLNSLSALNRLIRTNKRLSVESSTDSMFSSVAENMDGMSRKRLWKLFGLPVKLPPAHLVFESYRYPPGLFSSKYSFSPAEAFKSALLINYTTARINSSYITRRKQSESMKITWALKKKKIQDVLDARQDEIKTIYASICINYDELNKHPRNVTESEEMYLKHNIVLDLNYTFRDFRIIAHADAGILNLEDNAFMKVAVKDLKDFTNLTKDEKLYILGINIAYEHFLFNYTNYLDIIHTNGLDVNGYDDEVQWLFKPPSVWPWVNGAPCINMPYEDEYENSEDYSEFREFVDELSVTWF